MCFASAHASVSAVISLPISLSPQKQQETVAHHQKFSLQSPYKCSSTTQCKADHICMPLLKNPSSCVLSHACFSRTSFLLCLLQLNVPSRVCPSKIPSNWLSQEPLSFYFTMPYHSSMAIVCWDFIERNASKTFWWYWQRTLQFLLDWFTVADLWRMFSNGSSC